MNKRADERPLYRCALLFCGAALASACSGDTGACTFMLVTGIIAEVGDATTGAAICDAEVTATRGSGEPELLQKDVDCTYQGTWNSGDYVLRVRRAGYAEVKQAVHVASTGGHCPRADTVTLSVMLEPTER